MHHTPHVHQLTPLPYKNHPNQNQPPPPHLHCISFVVQSNKLLYIVYFFNTPYTLLYLSLSYKYHGFEGGFGFGDSDDVVCHEL